MKSGRHLVTDTVTRAVTLYLIDRRYSVHHEIGVKTRRRLDILSLNTKGHIIGVEVKSGIEDFRADQKWRTYLPYVNKLYFAFDEATWDKHKDRLKRDIGNDAGIMVVGALANGFIRTRIVKSVSESKVESLVLLHNFIKMAWRGGESCAHYARRASRRMTSADPLSEPRKKRGVKEKNRWRRLPVRILWKGVKR